MGVKKRVRKFRCLTALFTICFGLRVVYGLFEAVIEAGIVDFYNRLIIQTLLAPIWDLPLVITFLTIDYNNIQYNKQALEQQSS